MLRGRHMQAKTDFLAAKFMPVSIALFFFAVTLALVSGCTVTVTGPRGLQEWGMTANPNTVGSSDLSDDAQGEPLHPSDTTSNINTESQEIDASARTDDGKGSGIGNRAGGTKPAQNAIEILAKLGEEKAVPYHLVDGQEYALPLATVLDHGEQLFTASWTIQDGGGRPLSKGTGAPLSDSSHPLVFPNNFNRISGPDANACSGCHNLPFGVPGGGGDIVTNVFVLGQRFDFATFDRTDATPLRGAVDEAGEAVTLQTIANSRATPGIFGSGYIEMLARQMTTELQAIRNTLQPGESKALMTKGGSFGMLRRHGDGTWNTAEVEGLIPNSLATAGSLEPPTLVICPFHQASAVISLRQFTNNAFNHHHGIQSAERFGDDADPDADGIVNELTRADITAVTLYQAALAVPGRLIPREPIMARAIWEGEQLFDQIGCTGCHVAELPLENDGWIYTEPNPFNPPSDPQVGAFPTFYMDLTSTELPLPRLLPQDGVVSVPAYTDLKLHDITSNSYDPNVEALDMQNAGTAVPLAVGNRYFITRRLWGVANEPPYFHHGLYTTLRQAVLGHAGEALATRQAYEARSDYEQNALIEFLKSLQILPPGTASLYVDEYGEPVVWPPVE